MNDKRLIDANALMRDVMGLTIVSPEAMNYANAVAVAIANAPTIDAVEVVRCRDCIYASTTKFSSKRVACAYWAQMVSADGYCSNGVTEGKYNGNG